MEISEKIAEFIVETNLKEIPEEAVNFTRGALIDTVGVALAGSTDPAARIIKLFVEKLGSKPVAGVIGGQIRATSPLAALANGVMSHVMDYDDNSGDALSEGCCHPSGVFMSTVLPLSDELGASGKEILHLSYW
jgi:2-methylcitrate dehydratase PrpD